MKKTNRKKSPNRIKCQISGQERMSNKTYLANKGEKFGVTGNVWASFYLNKESYNALVQEVSDIGFNGAAEHYGVDKDRLKKWLRYNGRGGFVKIANNIEERAKNVKQTLATV
jgi:hypothetical protein